MVSYYRTAQRPIPRAIWLACLDWGGRCALKVARCRVRCLQCLWRGRRRASETLILHQNIFDCRRIKPAMK